MATEINAGLLSFTGVADGRHREYSTWSLLDHLPGMHTVEGVRLAQQWVSTPELVDRRLYAQAELAASRYLSLCLLAAPAGTAVESLDRASAGRSFDGERTYLRGAFELVKTYVSARVSVDAEAIPFRPNQGVFVTAQDHAPGATTAALEEALAWYDQVHIPDLLRVRGVVGCWWFEAQHDRDANPLGRTIRVYWLDEDPVTFHDDLAARTPGMQMMDLRPAYRTLVVGSYRSIPWPLAFDWSSGRPGRAPW